MDANVLHADNDDSDQTARMRRLVNTCQMFCSSCGSFVYKLGPVVQSVVSLTSSLRVISLTILADSIHNILIFFAEKM